MYKTSRDADGCSRFSKDLKKTNSGAAGSDPTHRRVTRGHNYRRLSGGVPVRGIAAFMSRDGTRVGALPLMNDTDKTRTCRVAGLSNGCR